MMNNPILAEVGSTVKVGKHNYTISSEPIKDGDMIWNEASKSLDLCVAIFSDGDMVVQFMSGNSKGMRASLNSKWFQKAIRQK